MGRMTIMYCAVLLLAFILSAEAQPRNNSRVLDDLLEEARELEIRIQELKEESIKADPQPIKKVNPVPATDNEELSIKVDPQPIKKVNPVPATDNEELSIKVDPQPIKKVDPVPATDNDNEALSGMLKKLLAKLEEA